VLALALALVLVLALSEAVRVLDTGLPESEAIPQAPFFSSTSTSTASLSASARVRES